MSLVGIFLTGCDGAGHPAGRRTRIGLILQFRRYWLARALTEPPERATVAFIR